MERSFTLTTDEVLKQFNTTEERGLNSQQVRESRSKYGSNSLPEDPPTPMWKLILEQFKDQLVLILLGSAAISFVLALFEESDDWTAFVDPVVILTILILNAVVGVTQESSAEKAIAALQEYSANEAKVIRDGHVQKIKAEELVPGDVITVSVGDRIPADCRLLSVQSNTFAVDQAILTGESESVSKETRPVSDAKAVKQDQINMLFSGTTVVTGHAVAIVAQTGSSTAIGDIHESITSQISQPTPLKEKLNDFGDMLAKVITVICIAVWLINIQHFNDPSHGGSWAKGAIYYLKIAVSLGVAAIPEGLAVVITTCLALGTRKMAAKNAIVRSLPSVETLGSCSVICSDKTGTLTTNQMSVEKIVFFNKAGTGLDEIEVQGTTFSPEGNLVKDGRPVHDAAVSSSTIKQMSEVLALCNEAELAFDSKNNTFSSIGEPTEGALRVLVEKIGTDDSAVNQTRRAIPMVDRLNFASKHYESQLPVQSTYEFSRDRKSMSVLAGTGSQQKLLVKGAPESILARCSHALQGPDGTRVPLSKRHTALINEEIEEYGIRGLRVIAVASIEDVAGNPLLQSAKTTAEYAQLEQKMTLIGLVGMLDPPRPEVAASIRKCKSAGIRVIVITGDNQTTAETICRQIGIFGHNEDLTGKSYTGRQFDSLTESEQAEAIKHASLFSRVEPSHKSRMVDLLQAAGEVVAMTGDGVNDAPALKKADIGVAMGSGTDVAKLAADMVLADDNFATIEVAIEEGRSIYSNTQQFIRYLISSNIGEVVSIFLTAALGMPEALIPVQLLWVNLVTDGLPATALSFNPPDHDAMRRAPRKRDEPLISGWLFFRYMVIGTYVGIATVGGYVWWYMFYQGGPQISFYQLVSRPQYTSVAELTRKIEAFPRMLDDLEGLPDYGLLYLLAIIDPHATRLDGFFVDSCCYRDAECHERAVLIRVFDDYAALEEHEADLRHHSVDGASSCHPLCSLPTGSFQHRTAELDRMAGSVADQCARHTDRRGAEGSGAGYLHSTRASRPRYGYWGSCRKGKQWLREWQGQGQLDKIDDRRSMFCNVHICSTGQIFTRVSVSLASWLAPGERE
jgi:Ca2+ transporting ATPase